MCVCVCVCACVCGCQTIANNLLIDYYNDPSKKSYNDYLEAVADTRADEIDKSAKDVTLHPEAVQGMEDPRDRMQAEHQQLEEMKQALEDGDGMFAGLTAALDWHKCVCGAVCKECGT